MAILIGITGQSGTGKTVLSKEIANKIGAQHIELDKYRKQFLGSPAIKKALKLFYKKGKSLSDEEFNPNTIAGTIKDPKKWQKRLASFTIEKYMIQKMNQDLRKSKSDIIIVESELLPQLKIFKKCDYTVLLEASKDFRYNNIKARDNIDEKTVELGRKYRLADEVVYEDFDFDMVLTSSSKNYEKEKQKLLDNILDMKKSKEKTL